jgi:peptidoglycan/xylan/chitin deacetylase (PgdA/CDA1 family)
VKLFEPGKPLGPGEIRNLFFSARRLAVGALYHAGLLQLFSRLPRRSHRGLLILMYHSIGKPNLLGPALRVSAKNFSAQLNYLSRHFQIVSLESAVRMIQRGEALPENAAALTFDDGFRDNYEIAFPMLRERRLPATFFVAAEPVSRRRSLWNYKLIFWMANSRARLLEFSRGEFAESSPIIFDLTSARRRRRALRAVLSRLCRATPDRRERLLGDIAERLGFARDADPFDELPMLTPEQLREMAAAGITIGSHTVTHPALSYLRREEALGELVESKKILEAMLERPVRSFAYPFGEREHFNAETMDLAREAGYEAACTTVRGINRAGADPLALLRVGVQDDPPAVFAFKLSRFF